jgi:hypothetical protein
VSLTYPVLAFVFALLAVALNVAGLVADAPEFRRRIRRWVRIALFGWSA